MPGTQFHHEHSVMVASTAVTDYETHEYMEKYVAELVERGDYSKVLILSGSHGSEDGLDALNSLDCLSDGAGHASGESQTREFYAGWVTFLKLPVEGEDPRDYDPATGRVKGIKSSVSVPDWAARKPERVPNRYKATKAKISNITIGIVDIAHYHGKPEELLQVVAKFSPTSLW